MIIKGSAYIEGGYENCYIGIENGRIDFVKKSLTTTEKVEKFDGVILPAGTDLHVHFRDPGMTEKEDFYTGSVSAACGGITTVMDMPNNDPPTDTHKRLKEKIKIGEKKSVIDFGLYGLLSEEVEEMSELTDFFKVFMAPSTAAERYEREELERLLEKTSSLEVQVAFHCEDEGLFQGSASEDLSDHDQKRPLKSELSAIEKLDELPGKSKHVCHMTSKKSLNRIERYGFTGEVTPHHLFLNTEAMLGPFGKVNPPLRSHMEQYELWEEYERGKVDFVASDHAPHKQEEKEKFHEAPSGLPGVETLYPLLLNEVTRGRLSISTVVDSVALNPAKRLGLKKGKIEEGYRADLISVDFRDDESIKSEKLHYKCGWTPFEDFQGIFPKNVLSKGEFIVEEKEFIGEQGKGDYIKKKTI